VGANRHDPGRLCTAVSCAKQMLLIYTLPPQLDLHERGVQVQMAGSVGRRNTPTDVRCCGCGRRRN